MDCLKNRWINYNICASELFLFGLSLGIPRIVLLGFSVEWILVSSTGKISDGCIRDLEFNPRLH